MKMLIGNEEDENEKDEDENIEDNEKLETG